MQLKLTFVILAIAALGVTAVPVEQYVFSYLSVLL